MLTLEGRASSVMAASSSSITEKEVTPVVKAGVEAGTDDLEMLLERLEFLDFLAAIFKRWVIRYVRLCM